MTYKNTETFGLENSIAVHHLFEFIALLEIPRMHTSIAGLLFKYC